MKIPGEPWAAAPSEVSRVATHGTEIGYETFWTASGVLDFSQYESPDAIESQVRAGSSKGPRPQYYDC